MKNVMVTLLSKKPSELSSFLNSFYNKSIISDTNAFKWSCFFKNASDTIALISTLADNNEKFSIETLVSIDKNITFQITQENIEPLIKIFTLLQ